MSKYPMALASLGVLKVFLLIDEVGGVGEGGLWCRSCHGEGEEGREEAECSGEASAVHGANREATGGAPRQRRQGSRRCSAEVPGVCYSQSRGRPTVQLAGRSAKYQPSTAWFLVHTGGSPSSWGHQGWRIVAALGLGLPDAS